MLCTKDYRINPEELDWSCPSEIEPYTKMYELSERKADENAWLHGQYVYEGVLTALDQGFSGKKAKMKYPDKPYSTKALEDKGQMDYEEKMRKVKGIFMQLGVMKANFEITHPKEGDAS